MMKEVIKKKWNYHLKISGILYKYLTKFKTKHQEIMLSHAKRCCKQNQPVTSSLHQSKCRCREDKTDENLIFISKKKKVAQVVFAACLPPADPLIGQRNEKLCRAMAVIKSPLRGSQAWVDTAGPKACTYSWGEWLAQPPHRPNGHYSPSIHYDNS